MTGGTRILLGVAAVASGTLLLGWLAPVAWGVVAGIAWSRLGRARVAADSAAAAALGWLLLLGLPMAQGAPVPLLARRLAGAMQVPTMALVAMTLILPALLAGTAAWVAAALRRDPAGPPGTAPRPRPH